MSDNVLGISTFKMNLEQPIKQILTAANITMNVFKDVAVVWLSWFARIRI
jgi:hypothetical protein